MIQAVRDKVLAALMDHFSGEQLSMIDKAVADALHGYRVEVQETLPDVVSNEMVPEIAEYLGRKKSKGCSKGTLEQYRYVLKTFALYSRKKLQEVTDLDVIAFLDSYETYNCIGLRRKDGMRIILNGFFRYLTDTGRVHRNPMCTVEAIRFEKRVRESLSDIELERLRKACTTLREHALVEFLFATGCRVDETIRVNREDIDYDRRLVKVFGKGKKERYVCLNAAAVVALGNYLGSRTDSSHALFVSQCRPNRRLGKNALENIIRKIGQRAGLLRRVFPHLLRHTFATFLLRHGMPIQQLQVLMGHSDTSTTLIYAHVDPEQIYASYRQCMAA